MKVLCSVVALVALAGCQQELGRPPVPRFTIQPEWVPQDDGHQTPVTLDASGSADELDDPTVSLEVAWTFDDGDVRYEEGGPDDEVVVLSSSGLRPVTITLTVTDPEGLSASLSRRLGIAVPEP